MSDSAVRLSDTCCQTVRESAVSAVRLSGTVRRCPGFAVRLSDQGSAFERLNLHVFSHFDSHVFHEYVMGLFVGETSARCGCSTR